MAGLVRSFWFWFLGAVVVLLVVISVWAGLDSHNWQVTGQSLGVIVGLGLIVAVAWCGRGCLAQGIYLSRTYVKPSLYYVVGPALGALLGYCLYPDLGPVGYIIGLFACIVYAVALARVVEARSHGDTRLLCLLVILGGGAGFAVFVILDQICALAALGIHRLFGRHRAGA